MSNTPIIFIYRNALLQALKSAGLKDIMPHRRRLVAQVVKAESRDSLPSEALRTMYDVIMGGQDPEANQRLRPEPSKAA
jgi:hypothetical protein